MFEINEIFTDVYPPEAAEWCLKNGAHIEELEVENDIRKFRITENQEPTVTLASVKAAKLAEINAAADVAISTMTATYPPGEVATFDKQEVEARAYLADATAPTPLLSALSTARGVELSELVRRVIVRADAFAVASGTIIGQRQALEDQLDLAQTIEEVQALIVEKNTPPVVEADATMTEQGA